MKKSKKQLAARVLLMLTLGVFHAVPAAYALPSQGTLNNTNAADITVVDKQMNISGKGLNNIINWAAFNIDKGETVKFNDKNNYLNLVHGVDISRIYGAISGGNMVYLVNPNGILFAEGARLDNVGSFLASTRNISSINKDAFLKDPSDAAAVLGADSAIMDNKDYYPEDSNYVPKISVADIQLTNVPESATKIILDGPGGVILKNTELLDKTAQILTRKDGGEIGIGSDTGEVVLTDAQKQKIALIDGEKVYDFDNKQNNNVVKIYKAITDWKNLNDESNNDSRLMISNNIELTDGIESIQKGQGIIEGLGYTISNFSIGSNNNFWPESGIYSQSLGLFSSFEDGEIRNINLSNISLNNVSSVVNSHTLVGGLASTIKNSLISNVNVQGEIYGSNSNSANFIGGLAGLISNTEIRNSSSDVSISITSSRPKVWDSIGGIVGRAIENNSIYNVINNGDILRRQENSNFDSYNSNTNVNAIGGIVGSGLDIKILGSENSGNITITSDDLANDKKTLILYNLAGIIGDYNCTDSPNHIIGDCYNFGKMISEYENGNGGIGHSWGNITINHQHFSHDYYYGIVVNASGIATSSKNISNGEYYSKGNGELLKSYYIKDDIFNSNIADLVRYNELEISAYEKSCFGESKRSDELLLSYRHEMSGIYDVDSIGEGISNTPKPTIDPKPPVEPDEPDIPEPPVDPKPPVEPDEPDSEPPVDPEPSIEPDKLVKPIVPSIIDPNDDKEYGGIISTVTQDHINGLIEKNNEGLKQETIQDIKIKKPYKEITPFDDYNSTKEAFLNKLAQQLEDAKRNQENSDAIAKQQAYETLKSYVKLSDDVSLDEKVYEAFLGPISEKLEASKISEYDSKVSINFVKEIGGALYNGLKHIPDQTVQVGGKTYTIHYELDYIHQNMANVVATVTWKEGKTTKSTQMTLTNVNTKDGAKALAEYTYGLARLNKDVWTNAATELISVGLKDIPTNASKTVKAKKLTEFGKKLINALSDDALAEAFATDIGGATEKLIVNEGKNFFKDTAKNRLNKLIEKEIPGGSDIIKIAQGLQQLEQELDNYAKNGGVIQNSPNQVDKAASAYWTISETVNKMIGMM